MMHQRVSDLHNTASWDFIHRSPAFKQKNKLKFWPVGNYKASVNQSINQLYLERVTQDSIN